MVAVSVGGTLWGINSTTIHYKNVQSDAPVVMTVNGDEVRADEYAAMLYNYMLYYEQMYAQFGMTDIWSDEELGGAMMQMVQDAAYNQVVSTHVVLQHFDEAGPADQLQRAEGTAAAAGKHDRVGRRRRDLYAGAGGHGLYAGYLLPPT